MVTINKNIIGNWKFRGVGDKGLLKANIFQEKCDPKREFQTVEGGGRGGGKQNELLMQDYGYFSINRLHNHNKMLGREIILSHLIKQN